MHRGRLTFNPVADFAPARPAEPCQPCSSHSFVFVDARRRPLVAAPCASVPPATPAPVPRFCHPVLSCPAHERTCPPPRRSWPASAGGARASGALFPASRRELPPAVARPNHTRLAVCGNRKGLESLRDQTALRATLAARAFRWGASPGQGLPVRCLADFGAVWWPLVHSGAPLGPFSVRFRTDLDQFLSAGFQQVPPRARPRGAIGCQTGPKGAMCFSRS